MKISTFYEIEDLGVNESKFFELSPKIKSNLTLMAAKLDLFAFALNKHKFKITKGLVPETDSTEHPNSPFKKGLGVIIEPVGATSKSLFETLTNKLLQKNNVKLFCCEMVHLPATGQISITFANMASRETSTIAIKDKRFKVLYRDGVKVEDRKPVSKPSYKKNTKFGR